VCGCDPNNPKCKCYGPECNCKRQNFECKDGKNVCDYTRDQSCSTEHLSKTEGQCLNCTIINNNGVPMCVEPCKENQCRDYDTLKCVDNPPKVCDI